MPPTADPSPAALSSEELSNGYAVARQLRVAIFVVAYNAEEHIRATLERIPDDLRPLLAAIYVIDDDSTDETTCVARRLTAEIPELQVFTTPHNLGYGGNQKLGYRYAIEQGFDVVVLLHGDGQYAPEVLPRLIAPFADPEVAAVFGSRMMVPGAARKGRMPLYKRIGNRWLTFIQNKLLGSGLSEFHSGYRAYRVSVLAEIPFAHNTDGFHFDTEIIIQLLGVKARIVEVPIPTFYGDEICRVNGIAYAYQCIATVLRALANRVHLVYHPKFDLEGDRVEHRFKTAPTSLHQHVLKTNVPPDARVLELGAGGGEISLALHEQGRRICAVDLHKPDRDFPFPYLVEDLDSPFAASVVESLGGRADVVIAVDVIEYLSKPEASLAQIVKAMAPGSTLIASTGNVAYFPLRLTLLLGMFNYGKKGILDLTHQRLFTVRSFCRTLEGEGFRVDRYRGFGPPIQDMVSKSWFWRMIDRFASVLARIWPSMFSYQFVVEATRLDDTDELLAQTVSGKGDADDPEPVSPSPRIRTSSD